MMQKHIVLIEDNLYILAAWGGLLETEGYKVTKLPAFPNVETIIDLNPDCFVLDEQLPHISGHIICMLLKSKPQTKDIPVILMSAADELENFAGLCEADAFLKKPFTADSLLNLITEMTN
jgi:DNA-binding response OmpR family regulator